MAAAAPARFRALRAITRGGQRLTEGPFESARTVWNHAALFQGRTLHLRRFAAIYWCASHTARRHHLCRCVQSAPARSEHS
jgi:hypothetical protein